MRLWWVSMSLFMELEGELGVLIFSCCSSNGIPHWLMRLERSEELVVVFSSSTSSNSLEEGHGGLVGQVHLHLHPVVVDGG